MFLMFLMFLISLSFQLNCFHWNPAQHLVGWSPSIGHVHPAGFRARSSEFSILFWIFGSSWLFRFHASFEALIAKTVCSASMMKEVKHFAQLLILPTPPYSTGTIRYNWIQWTFQRGRSPELRQQEPVEDHFVSDSPCRTWQGHRGWHRKSANTKLNKDDFWKNGHFSHFWSLKILQRLLGYLAVHPESN